MGRSKSQRGMGKWNKDAIEPTITEGRRGLASSDSPSSSSSSTSSSSSPHAPVILKRKERSKSQRGLDKWKDQLSAEDQEVLALTTAVRRDRSNPSTPRLAQAPPAPTTWSAEDRPDGGVCSPRWLDDSADDSVKRYRTGAQINAMASLYAVNPAVFS